MAENENVIETSPETPVVEVKENPVTPDEKKPSKWTQIKAGIKEWFRKLIVGLKRKTQNIPFVCLLITSFVYLCFLGTLSKYIEANSGIKSLGIFEFVNTLASILILLLFLNAFPKRKKVNYIFLGIVFAVLALMMVMDILFYVNIINAAKSSKFGFDVFMETSVGVHDALNCAIVHLVLLAITAVVLATLPLYKKLICKINTSKELVSNNMDEEIDTSEEDG